jgi:hypothetical protein
MRKQLFGFVAAALLAAGAQATPIVSVVGAGSGFQALTPGQAATITLEITPDSGLVSGFNLIFAVSDTTGISLVSCAAQPGVQSSCPVGGVNFSFGAALSQDASAKFTVASFTVNVSPTAAGGTTITLTGASTITDSGFNDIFVGPQVIAQVVTAPEPAVAGLLAAGLGGLALLGRKRNA